MGLQTWLKDLEKCLNTVCKKHLNIFPHLISVYNTNQVTCAFYISFNVYGFAVTFFQEVLPFVYTKI